jgi:hypothetical protein
MVVYCSRQTVDGLNLDSGWFHKRMSGAFSSLPDTRGTPITMVGRYRVLKDFVYEAMRVPEGDQGT